MYVYVAWHMGGDRSGTRKGPEAFPRIRPPVTFYQQPLGSSSQEVLEGAEWGVGRSSGWALGS